MNALIIIGGVLAMLHFIYEGIVMPSIRLSIRHRFFALRDQLRDLKFEHGDDIGDYVFNMIDEGLSNNISNLHNINFYVIGKINNHIDADESLRSFIVGRMKLIEDCKVDEVKKITSKSRQYLLNAALVNSGAWFVYLLPIAIGLVIPAILIFVLISKIKAATRKAVNNTLFAPPLEFNRSIGDIGLLTS